jgi:hypothetical protein
MHPNPKLNSQDCHRHDQLKGQLIKLAPEMIQALNRRQTKFAKKKEKNPRS